MPPFKKGYVPWNKGKTYDELYFEGTVRSKTFPEKLAKHLQGAAA